MPRPHLALALAVGLGVLAAPAFAQTCLAAAPFARNYAQLSSTASTGADSDELGASFAVGGRRGFGALSGGAQWRARANVTFRASGLLGYQVPVGSGSGVQACPVVSAGYGRPMRVGSEPDALRSLETYRLGVALGGPSFHSDYVTVLASVSAMAVHDILRSTHGRWPTYLGDSHLLVGSAVGVMVGDALVVRPGIALPVLARYEGPVFELSILLNLGGRR